MRCLRRRVLALIVVSVFAIAGCGGDDDDDAAVEPTSTTQATVVAEPTTTVPDEAACPSSEEPLRIVLVNDDGVVNPAIDAMVDLLGEQEGVELTIVAPAEERSGSSDQTTPGGATYQEASTPGGNPAYSVNGFPADAVAVALDDLALDPHLFVSGVNPGQNVGSLAAISGTVGVGRTAVRRGYPALAVSAGLEFDDQQFAYAAELGAEWIAENCAALVAGTAQTATVTSINVPACPVAQMGPLQEVPRATEIAEGVNVFVSTCDQLDPAPATDVAALLAGYPSISQVEPDITPPGP